MSPLIAFLLGLFIAIPLAFLIDWVRRWWRFENLIRHIETPHDLSNCELVTPRKSSPSNVMALKSANRK